MRKTASFIIASFVSLFSFSQSTGLHFDGTNDYLAIAENTSVLTGSNFTFEAWVKPSALTSFNSVVNKGNTGNYFLVKLRGEDPDMGDPANINVFMSNGATNGQLFYNISMAWINQWHHLAVTYNGSTITLYIDGVSVATSSWTGSIPSNAGYLRMGSSYGNLNYAGALDEIRVWNVVRSQAQISANMNTEISTGSTGLVAYYRLNDGTPDGDNTGVTTVVDLVASPRHATLTNFAKTGTTSNFTAGNASPILLSVNNSSFKAIKKESTVQLGWKEQPNQFSFQYEIERSSNGLAFSKIGIVPGIASATEYNYTFIDAQPMAPVNYYRIKSVDGYGRINYSKSIAVNMQNSSLALQAYPNPVQSTLHLQINAPQGVVNLRLKDMAGKTLQHMPLQSDGSTLYTSLDVSRLAKGSYLIMLNNKFFHFVKR